MKAIHRKRSNANRRGTAWLHGQRGFALLAGLAALFVLAAIPAGLAAPGTATGPAFALDSGSVRVPTGFPSSEKRFSPSGKALRFRAFYSLKNAETWDGWTSANTAPEAETDCTKLLAASDHYTHAFIEDTKTGDVIWTSWEQ